MPKPSPRKIGKGEESPDGRVAASFNNSMVDQEDDQVPKQKRVINKKILKEI